MGVFIRQQKWESVNNSFSEDIFNMSYFDIIHPYWKTIAELPHCVQKIIGTFGVIAWMFALTGNVTVVYLMAR